MEHRGRNNNSSNNGNLAHGTGNRGGLGYLAQPGAMTTLLQGTQGTAAGSSRRAPTTFTELLREQHFSFLNGGRLVIDLNIEGGFAPTQEVVASIDSGSNPSSNMSNLNMSGSSAGSNSGPGTGLGPAGNDQSQGPRCICGRKRKIPESEGTSMNLDLTENGTHADEEVEVCECQNPPVQGNSSGSMNPHDASSSHGHANQLSQANPGGEIGIRGVASSQGNQNTANHSENSNRSGRSRRRGTPHRSIISASGNSSGESPRYQPPSIAARQGLVNMISAADQVPFRIRDVVTRRANLQSAFNSPSASQLAPGRQAFGSSVGLPLYSPSSVAASLSDAQGGTLGQTSNVPNIAFAQPYVQVSSLQPGNNPHPGGSSTRNVAENPLFNSTGLVQQLHHQPAGISVGNVNQGHTGDHSVQLRSGVNRRDPRLNGEQNIDQPNGNALPGVNSVNLERSGRAYPSTADQHLAADREELRSLHSATVRRVLDLLHGRPIFFQGNQVLNIDEENNEELDGMRLDVDRMTYEELLALGERIGDVNTGLSEEAILQRLKRRKYRIPKNKTPEEAESCCICLDEFENRQELGTLDCGHNFHFDCIKQWLMQKNFCPICKKTALPPN